MFELINLDIFLPALALLGSLKLTETGLTYPDPNTLHKGMLGYRLCKLIQYPDNDAWLYTSAFGQSVNWRGKVGAFSTWVPGQARTTGSNIQISMWLNESNGWSDEDLLQLVVDGLGYIYIHESGDKEPMTVQEYDTWRAEQTPQVQATTEQAQVSAG